MTKWLLGFVFLCALQAAGAEDLRTSIGPAFKKFISAGCVAQSKNDPALAELGVSVADACQCTSERFVDSLTEADLQKFISRLANKKEGEDDNAAGAKAAQDPEMTKKMRTAALACVLDVKNSFNSEAMKKTLVAKCKESVPKNGPALTSQQLDGYCGCTVDYYLQGLSENKATIDEEVDYKQEGTKAGMMCMDKLVQ